MSYSKAVTLAFFLGPAMALVILFFVLPVIVTVYASFTPLKNWNINKDLTEIIGTYNYEVLGYMALHNPKVKYALITTVVFVAVTLFINVVGGLTLAILTYFLEERISVNYRLLWLLPRMTPVAVYSLLWYYFFHSSDLGTLNRVLMSLGLMSEPVDWKVWQLPIGTWMILVFVNGLVGVSFGMIVFYSAIKSLPWEYIAAARVDGAGNLTLVRSIILPQLRWHLVFVTVWQLLSLLTTYAHIFLLYEWGTIDRLWGQTWSLFVFTTAFLGEKRQGLAAAAATVLVVIGALLGLLTLRIMGFNRLVTKPRGEL